MSYPPPALTTIAIAAQQALTYKPILLVDINFVYTTAYGSPVLHVATDSITWGGNTYEACVNQNSLDRLQQLTPTGIDTYPSCKISIADPASALFNSYELNGPGFKGAIVTLTFILVDKITGAISTDAQVKFVGRADAPGIDDKNLTFTVRSKIEVTRVTLPNVPISKLCPYPFPGTADEQAQLKGNPTNLYYPCGYLDALGVNDPSTGQPFTSCNYDIVSCQARGMYVASGSQNTGRFGAVQYEPPAAWANPHVYTTGQKASGWNTDNQAKYDSYVPLVYGGGLVKGIVANVLGDGNYIRFEVICGWGDCSNTWSGGISMVIVNNVVIPHNSQDAVFGGYGQDPRTNGMIAWWQYVNNGRRTGTSSGDSLYVQPFPYGGDVYGSMIVIECVVATSIQSNSNSLPDVLVVFDNGKKVRVYAGFTSLGTVSIGSDGVTVTGSGFTSDGFAGNGSDIVQLTIGGVPQQNVVASVTSSTTLVLKYPVVGAPYGSASLSLATWVNETGSPDGAGYTGLDYTVGKPVWTIMDMLVTAGAFEYTDFDIASAVSADMWCNIPVPFIGIAGAYAVITLDSGGTAVTADAFASGSFTTQANAIEGVSVGQVVGIQDPSSGFITLCIVQSISDGTHLTLQSPGYGAPISTSYSYNFLISHTRYKTNLVIQQRQGMAPLLNSIKLGCNMNIVVNNATNLLQFYMDAGLGDQQPAPIPGSNDSTPAGSYLATGYPSDYDSGGHGGADIADGRIGVGYYAYSFDETNILLEGNEPNYTSSLVIIQSPPQDTPNRIITPFQNEEISYEADTSTRVDTDDYNRMQQTYEATVQMAGVPNYDQLFRRANNYMARQFRGNPRSATTYGDTGGTLIVQLKCPGMKVTHLRVGHIVALSSIKFGLSLQPFRIQSIAASDNFAVATITMAWHDDRWFLDGYGNGPDPRFSISASSAVLRPPFAWQPYGGTQSWFASNPGYSVMDPIYPDPQTWFPSIAPYYATLADGTIDAQLLIGGLLPVNSPSTATSTPYIALQGNVDVSSGSVPAGLYYIAVVGIDATGAVTLPQSTQEMCRVSLTATGSLIVPLVMWRTGAVQGAYFVGLDPNFMSFQGYINPTSGQLPTTLTITSLEGASSSAVSSFPIPDQIFDHLEIQVKQIRHMGPVGDLVGSVALIPFVGGYGINSGYGATWSAHQWDGYSASIIGNDASQTGNQLLINFNTGNSTASDYITCPSQLHTVLNIQPRTCAYIIWSTPTISTDSNGNTVLTDANWNNSLGPHGSNVGVTALSGLGVSPIQVTTTNPHGFSTGNSITIYGVTAPGNTNVNGTWTVTVLDNYNFTVPATGNGDGSFPGSNNMGVFCYTAGGLAVNAEGGKLARFLNVNGTSWTMGILSNTATDITLNGPSPVTLTSGTVYWVEEPGWVTIATTGPILQSNPLTTYSISVPIGNFEDEVILVQVVTCDALGNPCTSNQCPMRFLWVFGREAASAFADPGYFTITPVSGNATIDLANGFNQRLVLTSTAVTILAPVYTGGIIAAGTSFSLYLEQDSSGKHDLPTFTGGSGSNGFVSNTSANMTGVISTGSQIQLNGTANTRTSITFTYHGQYWAIDGQNPGAQIS